MGQADNKRAIAIIGAVVVVTLAVILGVALWPDADPESTSGSVGVRFIYPVGTPEPTGYAPGLVAFQDLSGTLNTPAPGQVGSHYQIYWGIVQGNLTATPDWRPAATRVSAIATAGMSAWLSLTFYEDSFSPYAVATDSIWIPTQAPTVMYYNTPDPGSPGTCTKLAPDYSDANFQQGYYDAVTSLLAEFGDDPNVGGFILELGSTGETQNVVGGDYSGSYCPNGQYQFEALVSCADYLAWVREAMAVWRAGTDKPLYVSVHERACGGLTDQKSAATVMSYSYRATATPATATPNPSWTATPTPLYIGYRSKALQADIWDAYQGNDWGKLNSALWFADGKGGAAFTPGYGPLSYDSALRTGIADAMVYAGLSHGASQLIFQNSWFPYISDHALYAITTTVGTTAIDSPSAWVVLRSPEFKTVLSSEVSDYWGAPGPWEHLASVTGPATPTPACVSAVATAAAGSSGFEPPLGQAYVCKTVLAGTPAPEARNMWYYPASSTVGIDADDDWADRYGASVDDLTVTVRLLNTGTATWSLVYNSTGGVVTSTITNTNTSTWDATEFVLEDVVLDGSFTDDADMQLVTGAGGGQYVHSVLLEAGDAQATVTPTPTETPTETPTSSPTPTSSLTPTSSTTPTSTSTPTNTPTPTVTPTSSITPTPSRTPTASLTPTVSRTPTATRTATVTPTSSLTPTASLTPTPTSTSTPTLTPTASLTPTPTSTPTLTPTGTHTPAPIAGLILNEVCPNPNADWNLSGYTNPRDRAVELHWYNAGGAQLTLTNYTISWPGVGTYTIPRSTYIVSGDVKVIFGDALDFTIPASGTVILSNAAGTALDVVTYAAQAAGYCYQRVPSGAGAWATATETLGE